MKFYLKPLIAAIAIYTFMTPGASNAQQPTPVTIVHAKTIAETCPGQWEHQRCLQSLSYSNLALAGQYAEALNKAGKKDAIETLRQTCAASTAATKGEYPPAAMTSAFTTCANSIYSLSEETGIKPDQSHYQLLIAAILCLNKDPQCELLEAGLKKGIGAQ
ncbi:MAG: hypothetical protein CMH27_00085 [Micavibrio sp.]|nr:hypothetical protein [Micavibrio sp.]